LRQAGLRFGSRQRRLRLFQRGAIGSVINSEQHLALFHFLAVGVIHFINVAGDAGAQLNASTASIRPLKLSHWLMDFTTTSAALTAGAGGAAFCATLLSHPTSSTESNIAPSASDESYPGFCRLIIFIPVIVAAGQDAAGDAAPLPLSGLA
jgi:hypothetical protein